MKRILGIILLMLFVAVPVYADVAFTNGGFENADLTGWTLGTGQSPTQYTTSGAGLTTWNAGGNGGEAAAVMNVGADPLAPIQKTYNGSHSARVGDSLAWGYNGGGQMYNSISQSATVTGTVPGNLFFAWAAVLEISGHDYYSTPFFEVKVTDNNKTVPIYDVVHYELDNGFWTDAGNGWKYSTGNDPSYPGWQVENLDLAALGVSLGDSLTLEAIARDCTPSAHAMYVYLDGFGGKPPVHTTPEPATLLLLGLGLAGLATLRKKI